MLKNPDPDCDFLMEPDVAAVFKTDFAKFQETAKSWTKKYAM